MRIVKKLLGFAVKTIIIAILLAIMYFAGYCAGKYKSDEKSNETGADAALSKSLPTYCSAYAASNSFAATSKAWQGSKVGLLSIYADGTEKSVEEQLDEEVEKQLEQLIIEELEALTEEEDTGLMEGGFAQKVKSIINGDFKLNSASFLEALLNLIFKDFLELIPTLGGILAICVLSSVIVKFKSNAMESTNDTVFYACYGLIIILTLSGVWSLYKLTSDTVGKMQRLMEGLMPVLLTFMVALGGNVSAKVYQPAIALLSNGVATIIFKAVMPLFIVSVIFTILSNLSKNVRLDKFASFFRSATTWIIGITFTIFTSFLTMQGLTASTIDGVSIRAAKFATKNYIPILGGYLSDGFDLIMSSTMLIKNAFGVAGLVLLIVVVLAPIVKILAYIMGLKLISAITEPIADKRITSLLFDTAKNMNILFVVVLAVAFMFLITVMLIIMTGNVFT
ncbi:MAG: stage III sporulation protein AE [Clostridia bacterium]|nr:stage III sporulation protein AE [Clostridia bacterium]